MEMGPAPAARQAGRLDPSRARDRRPRRTGRDRPADPDRVRVAYRVRLAVNLVNGSTLAGLLVAAAGRARLARAADGLLVGARYRLPVPVAPAFTDGNVILAPGDRAALASMQA